MVFILHLILFTPLLYNNSLLEKVLPWISRNSIQTNKPWITISGLRPSLIDSMLALSSLNRIGIWLLYHCVFDLRLEIGVIAVSIPYGQWRTHDFYLGGVDNGEVKKSNNKMKLFKIPFKKFLESHGYGRTHVVKLRSALHMDQVSNSSKPIVTILSSGCMN